MPDTSKFPQRPLQTHHKKVESYIEAHRFNLAKVSYHSELAMLYISGGAARPSKGEFPTVPSDFYDMRPWFALEFSKGDYIEGFVTNPMLIDMPRDTLVKVIMDKFAANPRGYDMRPMGQQQVEHIVDEFKKAQVSYKSSRAVQGIVGEYATALLSGEIPRYDTFANLQYFYDIAMGSYWGKPLDVTQNRWWTTHSFAWANAAFDILVGDHDGLRAHIQANHKGTQDNLKALVENGSFQSNRSGSIYWAASKNGGNYRAGARYVFEKLIAKLGVTGVLVYQDYAPSIYDNGFRPGEYNHLNLAIVNQLYHRAYMHQTPSGYWTYMLSHRLVFEQLGDSTSASMGAPALTKVSIYQADMRTGGIKKLLYHVATLPMTPAEAGVLVRKYLPDIPTYNPGMNETPSKELITEHQELVMTPEMKEFAANQEAKQQYQYAYVLDNTWVVNERSFVSSPDISMAQQLKGQQITDTSPQAYKDLLVKEQFSPTLRYHRGSSQTNIIYGGKSFIGPLENWQQREEERWGVLANWASQSTVSAEKNYSTFSLAAATKSLPWPEDVKQGVLAGKDAVWNATITAYGVPNSQIEGARKFLTELLPRELAYILTSAASGWASFFQNYPDNKKLSNKAKLYSRATGVWEIKEAAHMKAFLEHFSGRLESYFIDPVATWEWLTKHGVLAESGNYNAVPGYGAFYDEYMGLIGAAAYLGSGGAMKGAWPTFLTTSQLGKAKAYVRLAIGAETFSTVNLGAFHINDTMDIYTVHNLLKETNVITGMKEMEVLDIPQFHIRWQTADGASTMEKAPVFTSNWKYRYDVNTADMNTLNVPFPAPHTALAYSGAGPGIGGLFHAQMAQTATLYNRLTMSWGDTTSVSSNVRIPINTPGISGGFYGLKPGKSFPLSSVSVGDPVALNISTPFKLTRTDMVAGGSVLYAAALVAALLYNTSGRRYV